MMRKFVLIGALITLAGGFAPAAQAYVGPGAGLGVLSALLAVVAAVVVTVVGILLWPLRALLRLRKRGPSANSGGAASLPPESLKKGATES